MAHSLRPALSRLTSDTRDTSDPRDTHDPDAANVEFTTDTRAERELLTHLLPVALDGAGVADLSLVRVLAPVAETPALAKEIPALVQRNLDALQPFTVTVGQPLPLAL